MSLSPEDRELAVQRIAALSAKLEATRGDVNAESVLAWIELLRERDALIEQLNDDDTG